MMLLQNPLDNDLHATKAAIQFVQRPSQSPDLKQIELGIPLDEENPEEPKISEASRCLRIYGSDTINGLFYFIIIFHYSDATLAPFPG